MYEYRVLKEIDFEKLVMKIDGLVFMGWQLMGPVSAVTHGNTMFFMATMSYQEASDE